MLQSDAMEFAIRAQRQARPSCGGSIVWQWNDAWPVVSWSLLDYTARPKPAWFAVRRAFAPTLPDLPTGQPDTMWHWTCSMDQISHRWERITADSGHLILRSEVPVHRLWLQADGLVWGDNSLDLTPHTDTVVPYKGRLQRIQSVEIHRWCPSRHGVDRTTLTKGDVPNAEQPGRISPPH
jgi:hypothetical protein